MPPVRHLAGWTALLAVLAGCAAGQPGPAVRQQDLDAWVGVPVQALDTHPLFSTMPMFLSREGAVEVRNYSNSKETEQCFVEERPRHGGSGNAGRDEFANCTTNWVVCNNIFYIENGRVLRYAPAGNCFTDERVWPQRPYRRG